MRTCLSDRAVISFSSISPYPPVGRANQSKERHKVLFPAPLYPMIPNISPFLISKFTLLTAITSLYFFVTRSILITYLPPLLFDMQVLHTLVHAHLYSPGIP